MGMALLAPFRLFRAHLHHRRLSHQSNHSTGDHWPRDHPDTPGQVAYPVLLGLWMEPVRWRQGLPVGLLMVGALPLGDHMQTFVGYPLRIFTAKMVGASFQAIGISSIGVDTILTFENGIAQVDLPCSGVKSLWTGGIFLIAATWIQQQSINLRWLLIGLVLAILLICANFMRVAILISVGIVGTMELLAEIIHVPLGVLGFGTACGIALYLLRRETDVRKNSSSLEPQPQTQRPAWLASVLIISVAVMAIFYTQRPQTGLTETARSFRFPADMITEHEPLTEQELWWLTKDGAESAQRHRFQWGNISGSMLLITSRTWRAHHRPERCFEVKGLSVDDIQTYFVMDSVPIRHLSLGAGTERNTHDAAYWFQSADSITDDYATRVWADLALQREQWILVSILFDSDHNILVPDDAELDEFYEVMVAVADSGLK